MQPEAPKKLITSYPDIADDPDEELVADVRKHWIGRVLIWSTGIFMLILLLALAIGLPILAKTGGFNLNDQATAGVDLFLLLIAVFVVIGSFISLHVYNQSRILITDENVIEIKQTSLFSRKVSHLNMINVEDVTVTKQGLIQTMLDFGVLGIETAGAVENFQFVNTPNPEEYRRFIIHAHEQALERNGGLPRDGHFVPTGTTTPVVEKMTPPSFDPGER